MFYTKKLWQPPGAIAKLLLIMRLTTIILIAAILQVSASSFAQRITLSERNAPLVKVFDKIRAQSGVDFLISTSMLNDAKPVSIQVKDAELNDVLKKIFADQQLEFSINEKSVVVSKKTPIPFVIPNDRRNLFIDAAGRILDEKGSPLEGATIVLKGTNRTAKTDAKGEFVIPNVPDDGVLVIRHVGYKQLEISLKDAVMPLEIKLNVETGELEEVKVVYNTGYQELNKERATGSFVHIDNELFNRRVGATILDRIGDLVPGLLAVRSTLSNGVVGTSLDGITIRGISTLNSSIKPLLVVDNFIYEGDPEKLNPNDVESITILKDAAAASIYGVKAGNGVIVITMKKGKANSAPAISFNSNFTIGEKPDLFTIPAVTARDVIALERKRFREGYYDGALNDNFSFPAVSPIVEILAKQKAGVLKTEEANSQIAVYEQHDIRNDVNKYLLQTAIAQQYSLSISGGTNNYRYYGSMGYDRGRPNNINTHNDRLTLNFSNTWNPVKNLEIATVLNWNSSKDQSKNNLGGYASVMTSPYQRIADEKGNALAVPHQYGIAYADTINFPGKLDWLYRPLDEGANGNRQSKNSGINLNGSINYSLIAGLKINLDYSWQNAIGTKTQIRDLSTFSTRDLINQYIQKGANNLPVYPYPLGGVYNRSHSEQTAWTWRAGLNLSRTFNGHDITSIVGIESREVKTDAFDSPTEYGYNPETNVFGAVLPGTWVKRPGGSSRVIGVIPGSLTGVLNRFRSLYGNLGYTYLQRYTLTASGRIDESNFFGMEANDRKKPLWSAGIKWDLSKESFYSLLFLPMLSIRSTYGYSGNVNAGISPLATASYYNPIAPLFVPFARLSAPPNPELKWENVRTVNLALDFAIKEQRISGSIEFYHKRGEDLLSDITVDPTSGFVLYKGNSSSMQTRGIELALNTRNFVGQFKWFSSINFSYQQDKIIDFTVEAPKLGLIETNTSTFVIVGRPRSSIYSYRWAGLNPVTGDAQAYLGDQIVGSTEIINKRVQSDLVYHGQTNPQVFGSFFNNFSYKNLSASVGINYQFGHYFRRQSFGGTLGTTTIGSSWVHEDYLKAWKKPGDELTTNVPGFQDFYPDSRYSVYQNSDVLIEKGDHIRLQDVRLNYSLTKNNIKWLPFTQIAFYVYAHDLGFIWQASRYNPDTQNGFRAVTPITFALGLRGRF